MGTITHEIWEYGDGLPPQGKKVGERIIQTHPVVMTDKQFRKFVANKLGDGVYGKIFKAAQASTVDVVSDVYVAWFKATTYDKQDVAAMAAVLESAGIMTDVQRQAITGNNWPDA